MANKALEEGALNNEKNLNASILKLKEEIAKKEGNIKALNDKIVLLNSEKLNFEAEVKKRVDENDKIHNKNYKVFNEKIANFDASKKELIKRGSQIQVLQRRKGRFSEICNAVRQAGEPVRRTRTGREKVPKGSLLYQL